MAPGSGAQAAVKSVPFVMLACNPVTTSLKHGVVNDFCVPYTIPAVLLANART